MSSVLVKGRRSARQDTGPRHRPAPRPLAPPPSAICLSCRRHHSSSPGPDPRTDPDPSTVAEPAGKPAASSLCSADPHRPRSEGTARNASLRSARALTSALPEAVSPDPPLAPLRGDGGLRSGGCARLRFGEAGRPPLQLRSLRSLRLRGDQPDTLAGALAGAMGVNSPAGKGYLGATCGVALRCGIVWGIRPASTSNRRGS